MKNSTGFYLILASLCFNICCLPMCCRAQSQDNIDFPTNPENEYFQSGFDDEDGEGAYSTFEDVPTEEESYEEPVAAPTPPPVLLAPGEPIKLEEKSIRLGRVPYRSLKEMMTQAVPLLRLLQKKTGAKEVRFVSSGKNYASILDSLARGTVDFAWVSPTVYLKRRDQDKLMPIAKARFGTETAYRGVFIAPAKGKVQGLEDLKGSKIGFVDPESASGYIYPMYLLLRLGINPHKSASVYFLKNHDNVLRAVLAGKLDAGVCLENTLESLKEKGLENKIIILAKTSEIPSDVIVCRQDCPINLRERFLEALLKIETKDLPGSPLTFLPAVDEDFSSVQALLQYMDSLKVKK